MAFNSTSCRRSNRFRQRIQPRTDPLGHLNRGHTHHILQLGQTGRQVISRRLPSTYDRLRNRPATRMWGHAVTQHPTLAVHHHQRIICTRRTNVTVALRDRRPIFGAPKMRFITYEPIDHRISRATMGIPTHRVAQRKHIKRVERQHARQTVIIPLGRMDRLGSTDFLGRLACKPQPPFDPMAFHRGLSGQQPP